MKKTMAIKRIFYAEGLGFFLVIVFLWLDELCDLPHHLFGAPPSVVNSAESILETLLVALLAGALIAFNYNLLKKIRILEGLLPICAHCKSIRNDGGYWKQVDDYICEQTGTEFTHTLCPGCAAILYPELYNRLVAEKPEV